MNDDSRSQREKLKEEYKVHYRKMREVRNKLNQTQKKQNIVQALQDMDVSGLMYSFDEFLGKVKDKVALAEAKLDVALESLEHDVGSPMDEQTREAAQRMQARETLRQVKAEMGLLYSDLEQRAESLQVEKTVGTRISKEKTSDKE